APRPTLTGELAKAPIIDVPVKRVAASSTTQIPVLHTLGALDSIVGVNQIEQIYRGPARKALEARHIPSYGSSRMQIDTEKIISLKPDAVLAASSEVEEFK
ncbi:ABC transporter substrate-binding protein, partial [Acinetobacter baumannii]|nr:ABC transporter substrate-binding protein [Acinetobacter baumannii]